jgi:ABC-type multidrug transport system fused ATPase/permease subunit
MAFVSRPFAGYALGALFFATLAQLLSTALPYISKLLIDALSSAGERSEILAALREWGGLYLVMVFLIFLSWRLNGIISVFWLARSKAYSFRILFDYLVLHSHTYFINRFAGAVANKVSHASDGADTLIEQIEGHYYPNILSVGGTVVLLYATNVFLGCIFSALVIVLILLNLYLVRRRRPLVVAYAESATVLRGVGVDLVTNIAAVWQYTARPYERHRLQRYIDDRTRKDLKRDLSQEIGLLINNVLVFGSMFAMMAVVYIAAGRGLLTIGDVVLVITLLWGTSFQLIFIGSMLNGFMRTYGEIEEGLADVLLPYDMVDVPDAKDLRVTEGKIRWNKVGFEFGGNAVFRDFDLAIEPGQRVGLIGPSGAGKTTFVSLLLRQYDLAVGNIEIDGQNIAEVTQDSLRRNIAVVPQEPMLFHRTIRENIAYGKPDATDGEIERVARKAQAHDFIVSQPQGYETLVGERGVKLSGGQRQRVAIARAMLKDAPILVLDEATSALDSESEVAIQKALHELMAGKTVVAIAHRLSTLREMDRLIVLDAGSIVEDGTHATLVNAGGMYANLWKHQAGGFLQE